MSASSSEEEVVRPSSKQRLSRAARAAQRQALADKPRSGAGGRRKRARRGDTDFKPGSHAVSLVSSSASDFSSTESDSDSSGSSEGVSVPAQHGTRGSEVAVEDLMPLHAGDVLQRFGDLATLVAHDGHPRHRFRVGDAVEVPFTDTGFEFSYFEAEVVRVYQFSMQVRFKELMDDQGSKHTPRVPLAAVRPLHTGRLPPGQAAPLHAHVDVHTGDGWWRAHVVQVFSADEWAATGLPALQRASSVVSAALAAAEQGLDPDPSHLAQQVPGAPPALLQFVVTLNTQTLARMRRKLEQWGQLASTSLAECGAVHRIAYSTGVCDDDRAAAARRRAVHQRSAWLRSALRELGRIARGARDAAKATAKARAERNAAMRQGLEDLSAWERLCLAQELLQVFDKKGRVVVDLAGLVAGRAGDACAQRSLSDFIWDSASHPVCVSALPADAPSLHALRQGGLPLGGLSPPADYPATVEHIAPPEVLAGAPHTEPAACAASKAKFPTLARLLALLDDSERGLFEDAHLLEEGDPRDNPEVVPPSLLRPSQTWSVRCAPGSSGGAWSAGTWFPRQTLVDPDIVQSGAQLWHVRRVQHSRSVAGRQSRLAEEQAAAVGAAQEAGRAAQDLGVLRTAMPQLESAAAEARVVAGEIKAQRQAVVDEAQAAFAAAQQALAALQGSAHSTAARNSAQAALDVRRGQLEEAKEVLSAPITAEDLRRGAGEGRARSGRKGAAGDAGDDPGRLPEVEDFSLEFTPTSVKSFNMDLPPASSMASLAELDAAWDEDSDAEEDDFSDLTRADHAALAQASLHGPLGLPVPRSSAAAGDEAEEGEEDTGISRRRVARSLGLGDTGLDVTAAVLFSPAELSNGDAWERRQVKAANVRPIYRCAVSGRTDEEAELYGGTMQSLLALLQPGPAESPPPLPLDRVQCRCCELSVSVPDAWRWLVSGPSPRKSSLASAAACQSLQRTLLEAAPCTAAAALAGLPRAGALQAVQASCVPPTPCTHNFPAVASLAPCPVAGPAAGLATAPGARQAAAALSGVPSLDALHQRHGKAVCALCLGGRRKVEKIFAVRDVRVRRNLPLDGTTLVGPGALAATAQACSTAWCVLRTREYWVKWEGRGHWHNTWLREQTLEHLCPGALQAFLKRLNLPPLQQAVSLGEDPTDPGVRRGKALVAAGAPGSGADNAASVASAAVRYFLAADGITLWTSVWTAPPLSAHTGVLLDEEEGTAGGAHRFAVGEVEDGEASSAEEGDDTSEAGAALLASPGRPGAGQGDASAGSRASARGEADAPASSHDWRAEYVTVSHVLARRRRRCLAWHAAEDPKAGGTGLGCSLPDLHNALTLSAGWSKADEEEEAEDASPSAMLGAVAGHIADGRVPPVSVWEPHAEYEYLVKWTGVDHAGATWEWGPLVAVFAAGEICRWAAANTRRMRELTPACLQASHAVLGEPSVVSGKPPPAGSASAASKKGWAFPRSPPWLGGELFPYQLEGLNWLYAAHRAGRGVILADEMGLGKTVQALALVEACYQHCGGAGAGPHIIVVPKSTMGNWLREARLWAPGLVVSMYTGAREDRDVIRAKEWYVTNPDTGDTARDPATGKALVAIDVLLVSYELVSIDATYLRRLQSDVVAGGRVLPVPAPGSDVDAAFQATGLVGEWNSDLALSSKASGHRKGFGNLIIDEGHSLKGKANSKGHGSSQRFDSLAELRRRQAVLLTGTPLMNRLEELWALLYFLEPAAFPSCEGFLEQYGDLTDPQTVARFQDTLRPHMLRRVKAEVMKDLPAKHEVIVPIALAPQQREVYATMLTRNYQLVHGSGTSKSALNNLFMSLRHMANHPYIVPGLEGELVRQVVEAAKAATAKAQGLEDVAAVAGTAEGAAKAAGAGPDTPSATPASVLEEAAVTLGVPGPSSVKLLAKARRGTHGYWHLPGAAEFSLLVNCAGKLQVLTRLLAELSVAGHRVLVFSQFQLVLDILEDVMLGVQRGLGDEDETVPGAPARNAARRAMRYRRIDGSTVGQERERIISQFNATDSRLFCLLMSTRAGGVGLNLATADTVIIFDSDWNPHMDRQAAARVHRYGQTKPVVIYRFVTVGTVEEKMQEKAAQKLQMERVATAGVGGAGGASGESRAPTKEELVAAIMTSVKVFSGKEDAVQASARRLVHEPGAVAALVAAADAEAAAKTARGPDAADASGAAGSSLFNVFSAAAEGSSGDAAEAAAIAEAEAMWAARYRDMQSKAAAHRLQAQANMGRGKRRREAVKYSDAPEATAGGAKRAKPSGPAPKRPEADGDFDISLLDDDDDDDDDDDELLEPAAAGDKDVVLEGKGAAADSTAPKPKPKPKPRPRPRPKPQAKQAAHRAQPGVVDPAAYKNADHFPTASSAPSLDQYQLAVGGLLQALQHAQSMSQMLPDQKRALLHGVGMQISSIRNTMPAAEQLPSLSHLSPSAAAGCARLLEHLAQELPPTGLWGHLFLPSVKAESTMVKPMTEKGTWQVVPYACVGMEPLAGVTPNVRIPGYKVDVTPLLQRFGTPAIQPGQEPPPQGDIFLCAAEAVAERERFVRHQLGRPQLCMLPCLRNANIPAETVDAALHVLRLVCMCDHCTITRHAWVDLSPRALTNVLSSDFVLILRNSVAKDAAKQKAISGTSLMQRTLTGLHRAVFMTRKTVLYQQIKMLLQDAQVAVRQARAAARPPPPATASAGPALPQHGAGGHQVPSAGHPGLPIAGAASGTFAFGGPVHRPGGH